MGNQRVTQVAVVPSAAIDSTIGLEQMSLYRQDGVAVDLTGFQVTGSATLVAGTVSVTGISAITANASVRVFIRTPAGTPANVGAPFITTITPGTGFTIKSTNVADTSIIGWEIKTY